MAWYGMAWRGVALQVSVLARTTSRCGRFVRTLSFLPILRNPYCSGCTSKVPVEGGTVPCLARLQRSAAGALPRRSCAVHVHDMVAVHYGARSTKYTKPVRPQCRTSVLFPFLFCRVFHDLSVCRLGRLIDRRSVGRSVVPVGKALEPRMTGFLPSAGFWNRGGPWILRLWRLAIEWGRRRTGRRGQCGEAHLTTRALSALVWPLAGKSLLCSQSSLPSPCWQGCAGFLSPSRPRSFRAPSSPLFPLSCPSRLWLTPSRNNG